MTEKSIAFQPRQGTQSKDISNMRNLILILGDQLDRNSSALTDMERDDSVWMAEVAEEATHVPCHKQRLAFFFSAMRHFRDHLREQDISVHYHQLKVSSDQDRGARFRDGPDAGREEVETEEAGDGPAG